MAEIDLLSDKTIRALRPKQTAYKLTDGRGMYLLVSPTGAKLWRLNFRLDDKYRTLAIGKYPDVGVADARDLRDEARKKIAKGIDPVVAKHERRNVKREQAKHTFKAAADDYFDHNSLGWSESHQRDVRRILDELKLSLGEKAMAAIEPDDIGKVLKDIEDRGKLTYCRDVRLYFRAVVRHHNVKNRQHRIVDPSVDIAIKKPPKVKHHSALEQSEVGPFLRKLALAPASPLVRIGTRMLLLTAVRTTELRKAEWREIDTKAKLWRVPAHRMKAGVEHVVPLAPQALDVLSTLRTLTGEGTLLFPNLLDPEQPMSENAIIGNLYTMGYAGKATGHGMRSTFSTWANENGFNADAIERQLAHAPRDSTRAAYLRSEFLVERRRMMAAWADFLDEAEHGAKVVQLRSA